MELIGRFCSMNTEAYNEDIARLTNNEILGFGEPDTANFALEVNKTDEGVYIISVYRKHSFSEIISAICDSLILVANSDFDCELAEICVAVKDTFSSDLAAVSPYQAIITNLIKNKK